MNSVGLRILLVEDNPVEASLAQNRLASSGEQFEVTHVETVAEALDRLRTTPFDAALLDLSLPDSGGISALERIAAVNPHLPIVVLTGLDDEALAAEAIRKGAQDYLIKGQFSASLIFRAIRYARERKHAEESLRHEQEFARALLENMVDGVVACDENFRLRWFNRTAREWHGIGATGIPPEHWADFYDLYCADGVTPMSIDNVPLARAFRGETLHDEGMVIRAKGQPTRHILANCAPLCDDKGCKLGAVAVMHDITDRKHTEEELRKYREHLEELVQQRTVELVLARDQAQAAEARAEAANRAKSVFLASMSHELRTPLNAVLGFSQLMRTDPTLNEDQKENLNIINRSGTHLLGLINDVLEMSRIEAGRVAREETNFDLWDTLETIKEMEHSQAEAKGLRFLLERDPALPRYVRADERKFKQVILNLAGNAVKFTHHGQITLRARAENGGTILRFEVEDTGPGIDAKTIPTLFEPFGRGGQNQEGAGLGLFISQKIVEFIGGQITVQSEPGKGSLFSFDIPCESVTAAEIAPKNALRRVASLASGQMPPRILVAEDNPESRLLMTKTLESTGFEVVEAENGMEAVQLFEERKPDLVLMDMRMPVMDGYEAIQRIRSTRRGKTAPIIAVTASAFEEDRQKILAIGADNFISKPVQDVELFEKMRLLLGIVYIYAEEQAEGAEAIDHAGLRKMVTQLPEDLTCELARAMAVLDLDGFNALLPKVTQQHPLLAKKLGELANGYRVTELARLFPTTIT